VTVGFSDNVLDKASTILDDVQPDETYPHVWWVPSSSSATLYRVQEDYRPDTHSLTWVTCTCPHGLNKGAGEARCYHVAAVLMLILANRPEPDTEHPESLYAE
jgi:hypothetical protein